jgi:uncharacterized UPF0160 family protein
MNKKLELIFCCWKKTKTKACKAIKHDNNMILVVKKNIIIRYIIHEIESPNPKSF